MRVATDVFGNALGNSLADTLNPEVQADRRREEIANRMTERNARLAPAINPIEWQPTSVDFNGLFDAIAMPDFGSGYDDSDNDNTNFSTPRKLRLEVQENGGVKVNPPSQKEVDYVIKTFPAFDMIDNIMETRAIRNNKLVVDRDGNQVTLKGNFEIFSARGDAGAAQLIDDINRVYKNLSYTKDSLTYKTDFEFTTTTMRNRDRNDIQVDYFELPEDRAQAKFNGQVMFDISADTPQLRNKVGAHEFSHTILGLPDTYHDITLQRPEGAYYLRGVPYRGYEKSMMSDVDKGTITGKELMQMILKIETMTKAKK